MSSLDALDYYIPVDDSPLGPIRLRANEHGLTEIAFVTADDEPPRPNPHTRRSQQQLAEYFAGQRQSFDLPLAPQGTPFQQRVWQALLSIPFGRTASYAEIATSLDDPKAVRAVGAANGRNPLAIVVPCHRVIGSDGSLTGYAGGLDRKRWLLAFEAGEMPFRLDLADPASLHDT